MNWKHRHIIGICLLLCGLSGFIACTDESPEFPREEEGAPISLTFQADVAGASTRAGEEPVEDDRVETLRIVIVSKATEGGTGSNPAGAEWKVEHNKPITSVGPQRPLEYTFQVAANSLKRVYLIANESGLVDAGGQPLDFTDGQFIPAEGTGRAPVDDYVFDVSQQAYTSSALPMTALYEINVPPLKEIENGGFAWPNPLYLVRAATKFSFEFTNRSTRKAVTVTGIDINRVITDRMYLMPHVNKITSEGEHKGKYWVFDDTKTETEDPKSYITDWVEWMGQEAKNSETGNDHQWLTDYEVPDKATARIATVPFTLEKIPAATDEQPSPSVEASNAIYLPESKTVKDSNDPLKLQEYSITVYTKEQAGDETEEMKTYPPQTLPHLASLFRNTHVMVGFIFTDHDIECEVDVIPYSEVILEPEFGL